MELTDPLHRVPRRYAGSACVPKRNFASLPSAENWSGRRAQSCTDTGLAAGNLGAHQWNQLAPVIDCILERIETANEEGSHSEFIIFDECFGHLFRCTDQRGGVAACAGRFGHRSP